MPVKDKSTYAIQAVENTLSILEAISEETGEFGVSQLSKRLGMQRSYIFRMLATFEKKGYVQQSKTSSQYRAGLIAFETGGRFLHQMTLLQKTKPTMEILAKNSGEAVYLAIPSDKDLLFIEMVDSTQKIRVMSLVGKRFSLGQLSAGKVIMAHNAKRDNLNRSFKSVSVEVACIDSGAIDDGVVCLAVPILNIHDLACASLCILAPDFRLSHVRIEKELLPMLKEAGEEVSAKLGHFKTQQMQMCG